jgi:2-keto-4-pentenoate hydratase/2-oxohepta-3-ene-1,7-dioic acid hydratase in catechol pathway
MKLMTFEEDGKQGVGVSAAEGVVNLTTALAETHPDIEDTESVLSIIRSGLDVDAAGEESLAKLRSAGTLSKHLVSGFKWLPPVMRPPKILALALNFQEHIDETSLDFFNEPIVFAKYPSNMIADGEEIVLPPFPQKVDEECELAVVMGRDARNILASEADGHIFGYTICNDVSARNRQRERGAMKQPYAYAKNFATFCPMGPWVVTKKEIGDPGKLDMQVRINGRVTRSGNSSMMIFNTQEVVAYCSDYAGLEAGDVISLGTFAGEKQIHPGDEVELEIEKIGVLRNRVVQSEAPWRNFTAGEPTGPLVRES